jgi:hypothetical protein
MAFLPRRRIGDAGDAQGRIYNLKLFGWRPKGRQFKSRRPD